MRRLYLTLGAPASGKSYFIKGHGLNYLTVSSDNLRKTIGGFRFGVDSDGDIFPTGYRNNNERLVWDTLWNIVENRMIQGLTTIVDSTLLYKGAFKNPNKLRKKIQLSSLCFRLHERFVWWRL